jgi:hypothetical protein
MTDQKLAEMFIDFAKAFALSFALFVIVFG